jgi:hypothetical protein
MSAGRPLEDAQLVIERLLERDGASRQLDVGDSAPVGPHLAAV